MSEVRETTSYEFENELRMKHEAESIVARTKIDSAPSHLLEAILDKVNEIIKEKKWKEQSEVMPSICPICECFVKHERKPFIIGVHNACIVRLIQ